MLGVASLLAAHQRSKCDDVELYTNYRDGRNIISS
jgi:hypothetical protein